MTDPTSLLAVGLVLIILLGAGVLVLWRMRAHMAAKADAEARMTAAMHELQLLAARLKAMKAAEAHPDAPPDSTPTT